MCIRDRSHRGSGLSREAVRGERDCDSRWVGALALSSRAKHPLFAVHRVPRRFFLVVGGGTAVVPTCSQVGAGGRSARGAKCCEERWLELEAPPGFEPGMEVLQTSALPLGDGADRTDSRWPGKTASYQTPRNQSRRSKPAGCLAPPPVVRSALLPTGGNNSVVECDLAKVEVAGSNPVSRSIRLTLQFAREPQGSLMAGHPKSRMS